MHYIRSSLVVEDIVEAPVMLFIVSCYCHFLSFMTFLSMMGYFGFMFRRMCAGAINPLFYWFCG